MTTLLTHAVGSSTFARTPRLSSRSISAVNFSLRTVRTRREGSSAFSPICICTLPGRVPRFSENTSAWRWTSSSTVSTFQMSSLDCLRGGGTVTKLFWCTVISSICCAIRAPIRGVRQQIQWRTSFVSWDSWLSGRWFREASNPFHSTSLGFFWRCYVTSGGVASVNDVYWCSKVDLELYLVFVHNRCLIGCFFDRVNGWFYSNNSEEFVITWVIMAVIMTIAVGLCLLCGSVHATSFSSLANRREIISAIALLTTLLPCKT